MATTVQTKITAKPNSLTFTGQKIITVTITIEKINLSDLNKQTSVTLKSTNKNETDFKEVLVLQLKKRSWL